MGLDFYGVFLQGSITTIADLTGDTNTSQTFDLWTQPVSGSAVTDHIPKALAYVQEVQVDLTLGMNSKISLTLAPPFEEGVALINSPLLQWGIGNLSISIGYKTGAPNSNGGGLSNVFPFVGFIQQPEVKVSTDIVVTINALGVGFPMNLKGGATPRSFPNQSPADAVLSILRDYGGVVDADPNKVYQYFTLDQRGANGPEKALPFFRRVIMDGPQPNSSNNSNSAFGLVGGAQTLIAAASGAQQIVGAAQVLIAAATTASTPAAQTVGISQGDKSDWQFIRDLVQDFHLDLFVFGNQVIIRDQTEYLAKPATKTFRLRGVPDPHAPSPVFPILEFQTQSHFMWLSRGIQGQVMADVDQNGNVNAQTINSSTTATSQTQPGTMDGNNPAAFGGASAGLTGPAVGDPGTTAYQQAQSQYKDFNRLKGAQVNVTTLGIPDLFPGDVVNIDGFKDVTYADSALPNNGIFDGPYGVTEVKHNVGPGGFTTTFTAIANFYPTLFDVALKPEQQSGVTFAPTPSEQESTYLKALTSGSASALSTESTLLIAPTPVSI